MSHLEFHPDGSPLDALFRQGMQRMGLDRRALGERLAAGGSFPKALRRLDEILGGERYRPQIVRRLAAVLEIPDDVLAVAWEEHDRQVLEHEAELDRIYSEQTMKRRGPHLWGRLPDRYFPSLISIVGPEFWLLFPLPEGIVQLPDDEQMLAVSQHIRDHCGPRGGSRLVGYDYCRALDEVFRFDLEGNFEGRVDASAVSCRSGFRIGGRVVDTTQGFSLLQGKSSG